MKRLLIMLVMIAGALQVPAQTAGSTGKAKVIIFLATRCPCAYNHQETFGNMISLYRNSIDFSAVFVDQSDDVEEAKDEMKNLGWDIPFVFDKKKEYLKKYNPSVTTECILVSPTGEVLYKGAVDDSPLHMGQVQNFYLKNAIEDYRAGRPVRVKEGKGIGCTITY